VIERSDITGHRNNHPINSPTPEGWQITKATQATGMAENKVAEKRGGGGIARKARRNWRRGLVRPGPVAQ